MESDKKIKKLELKIMLLTKAVQHLINVSGLNDKAKPPTIEEIKKAVLYGKAAIKGIDPELTYNVKTIF